jgi:hypothetical protein
VAPDRGAASSGAGLQLQGYLSDDNMTGVDGAEVQVGLLGPLGNLLWNASVITADGHFSAFVPMPTGLADGSYSVYAGYGALRAYSAISLDSAPPSLSGVSAVPLGNGTILIQAYALDNLGLGYVAVFLSCQDGQMGLFLQSQDGVYSGLANLDPSCVGTWQLQVVAADLAGNRVSLYLTLGT